MRSRSLFQRAVADHQGGRVKAAKRAYLQCLAQDPGHPDVMARLAVAHYQLDEFSEAIRLLERLPPDPGTLLNLGNCRQAIGDPAGAEACFRQALAKAPDFAGAWVNLGNALCAQARGDEAIQAYRTALIHAPRHPSAGRRLAVTLLDEGILGQDPAMIAEANARLTGLADDPVVIPARRRAAWQMALYARTPAPARAAFARLDASEQTVARLDLARIELDAGHDAEAVALCAAADAVPDGWRIDAAETVPSAWTPDRPQTAVIERNAVVLTGGRDWLVECADGRVMLENVTNANPEAGRYVRLVIPGGRLVRVRPQAETALDERVGLLGGLANYYHWLLDYLPRLRLLPDDVPLLINDDQAGFQRETLDLLGIAADRLRPVAGGQALRCRELIVPEVGARFQDPHPQAMAWIRQTLGRPAAGPARLWLSRKDARQRRVLNEDEVMAALSKRGFALFAPGDAGVVEQAAAFAAADVVVGPHGAAFTNLLFSPPSARVVELMPGRHRQLGFFPPLSRARGLVHRRLAVPSTDPNDQNADLRVDVRALAELLDEMGIG